MPVLKSSKVPREKEVVQNRKAAQDHSLEQEFNLRSFKLRALPFLSFSQDSHGSLWSLVFDDVLVPLGLDSCPCALLCHCGHTPPQVHLLPSYQLSDTVTAQQQSSYPPAASPGPAQTRTQGSLGQGLTQDACRQRRRNKLQNARNQERLLRKFFQHQV